MSNDSTTEASALGEPTTTPTTAWNLVIVPFVVINGVFLAINIWVLTCTILYGFKTSRWWNKPGTSSLTSGALYTSCVIAIAVKIPRYVVAQIWLYMGQHPTSITKCEVVIDCSIVVEIISFYADYTFLWLLQRRILNHPYIKDRVNKCVNYFSRGIIVGITIILLSLGLMFLIDTENFNSTPTGCIPRQEKVERMVKIGLAATCSLIIIQIILLVLSMYAASRSIIPRESESDQHLNGEGPPRKNNGDSESHNCCKIFIKNVIKNANEEYPTSPIHMAVKRSAICCIIIIGCDVVLGLILLLAISEDTPVFFANSLGFIQSGIHIFAMLTVFGFAGKVLTLCCPKEVSIVRLRRSRPGSVRSKAPEVILSPQS